LTNAQKPIIVDYEGIGIEVTAFDDNGFTITSLSAGTFGYLTTIQV
jgi:C-terminal processing protease CtpA/Prc